MCPSCGMPLTIRSDQAFCFDRRFGVVFALTSQFKSGIQTRGWGERARYRCHGPRPRTQGPSRAGLRRRHVRRRARLADRDRGTVGVRPYMSAADPHGPDETRRGSGRGRSVAAAEADGGRTPGQRPGERGRGHRPRTGPDRRRAPARTGAAATAFRRLAARSAAAPARADGRGEAADRRRPGRRRARPRFAAQGLPDRRTRSGAPSGAAAVPGARSAGRSPAARRRRHRPQALGRGTGRDLGAVEVHRRGRDDRRGGVQPGPGRRPRREHPGEGEGRCARQGSPPWN